ncbi:glycosyltransferase [Bradyrhizobium sp. SZCCHNR2009]|uniref:glycosyltransferase n=1 Tax=Bradyrhizobium sp. SZCCHNR2009 TaxID=3057375 RepID=UPI0028EDC185|nr:glycosyltransferase [Bradyrhizobium sp. SZCCHNR2009]
MPTLSPFLSAFAGAAIIVGLRLLMLPLLDPKIWYWRALLLGGSILLGWRYIAWRFTVTLAPLGWTTSAAFSWGFAILEALTLLSSSVAFVILARTKERTTEADRHAGWWLPGPPPRVDIFIPTYDERIEVLERTIVGAKAIDYPSLRVFILDDGSRPWLRDFCTEHGIGYFARSDKSHAKAGNINNALRLRALDADRPDFVAIFDADFVPHADFIERTLALFHEPTVGLAQTPQHFFNSDPIQHNLGIGTAYPDDQRHFFDNVQPSRDAWGIAACSGTSSMLRARAVEEIGGVPTESVTEDFLLTLRLSEHGWRTVYLNEALSEGLAAEGLPEYVTQRSRWCLGMMQIVRNVYNPFGHNNLRLIDRLSVLDSFLYWSTTFSFRLAGVICPLLYWWTGIMVVNANVTDVISYYVPYYLALMATLNWISKRLFVPILNDVTQLVVAWPIFRATVLGLLTKGPHKFSVTAKGGDRAKIIVQWPLMRPFIMLLALSVGGLIVSLTSDFVFNTAPTAGDGVVVVMFWTVYNILVLSVAIAVCIDRPRYNRPQRQIVEPITLTVGGEAQRGWIVNLGPGGARVSGPVGLATGATGTLTLPLIGDIETRVAAPTDDGYRLIFAVTPQQRAQIIERLHTASGVPGADSGDLGRMLHELARAMAD